jgi:hypothetical protein
MSGWPLDRDPEPTDEHWDAIEATHQVENAARMKSYYDGDDNRAISPAVESSLSTASEHITKSVVHHMNGDHSSAHSSLVAAHANIKNAERLVIAKNGGMPVDFGMAIRPSDHAESAAISYKHAYMS